VNDPEAIESTYDFFMPRTDFPPRTNLDGIRNILKKMDAPQRSPADFIDMSLLEEIEREGFFQKLR
jgi:hypothetical protein